MCLLWFCLSLAELLSMAAAQDLYLPFPGDVFCDPVAQRLLWEMDQMFYVAEKIAEPLLDYFDDLLLALQAERDWTVFVCCVIEDLHML